MTRLSEVVSNAAYAALSHEARVTPKPGLVDENNTGAHKDMTLSLLLESALAVSPFIGMCAESGFQTKDDPPEIAFLTLKDIGLEAEKAMYRATSGVNTHKGAIFSFCLIAGAYGRLTGLGSVTHERLLKTASQLAEKAVKDALTNARSFPVTHGDSAYREKKLSGARGEALHGYPSILNIALPALECAEKKGYSPNDASVYALLSLIAHVDDTCLYARGGEEGLHLAKSLAQSALSGDFMREAEKMDSLFIEKRLSPGGCADLLAAAIFITLLESSKGEDNTCESSRPKSSKTPSTI